MVWTQRLTTVLVSLFVGALFVLAVSLLQTPRAGALTCNNCVTGGDIIDGTIKSADVGANALTSADLASNSVTNSELVNDITVNSLTADSIFVTNLFNTEFLNLGNTVITNIPDNGGGTAAAFTLDASEGWAYLGLNCLDANGCDITLGNDFIDGDVMFVYNAGTNTVNFADTSGVSELAGGNAMGQWDTMQVIYQDDGSTNRWLEVTRSNN